MSFSHYLKHFIQSNSNVNAAIMPVYMRTIHPFKTKYKAKRNGLTETIRDEVLEIRRNFDSVRISRRHAIYAMDVIDNFDFYFSAVSPIDINGRKIVDYSTPRYHDVIGFDLHPIFFPSFAEPLITTTQYLDFADLESGSVALDLGAYSGLTSILMREKCGPSGRVVAVDADMGNVSAIRRNFALYERFTGQSVDLQEGAVWIHNDGITFSSEGNMGSSATDFVGDRLGASRTVPSFTLSAIAEKFELEKVDFIKCDIEGAEAVIFEDAAFFERFRPRIIAEVHEVRGRMTTEKLAATLGTYAYRCTEVSQPGSHLPLLECRP